MNTTTLNTNEVPLCFFLPSGIYAKTAISYWDAISNPANLNLQNSAALGTATAMPEFEVATAETYPPYTQNQGHSGAPVFNSDWELVALHHYAYPSTTFASSNDLSELKNKVYQWFSNFDLPRSGSVTHIPNNQDRIYQEAESIFRAAAHDIFEYGMESDFINNLEIYFEKYDLNALQNLARIILEAQAKPQVIAEALRWMGGIDHQKSRLLRLRILEMCLSNSSRWVRDGAAQGLYDMGDTHAIPYLRSAIGKEYVQELRTDLEKVLIHLERTR